MLFQVGITVVLIATPPTQSKGGDILEGLNLASIKAIMKSLEPDYQSTRELLHRLKEKRAAFAFKKLAAFCTSLKHMEQRLKDDGYNKALTIFESCRKKIRILSKEIDPLLLELAYLRSQAKLK